MFFTAFCWSMRVSAARWSAWARRGARWPVGRSIRRRLHAVLGEALAASALLTGNIKLDGALSIELKSAGALRLLFAECNDQGSLRGLARWSDPLPEALELRALPEAIMAITIGNVERGQRYQGLVDLQHANLADALENYFVQSEQLPARIALATSGDYAVGLMLQKVPDEGGRDASHDADAWNRVVQLTATLGTEELLATAPAQLLYRLYHEESVRLFESRPLAFGCSCSRERVTAMLRSLGPRGGGGRAGSARWRDRSDLRVLRAALPVRSYRRRAPAQREPRVEYPGYGTIAIGLA